MSDNKIEYINSFSSEYYIFPDFNNEELIMYALWWIGVLITFGVV